mmetsp:Transcript_97950/g.277060  ORF Transcript_97950/g.277060 Transcript_97950/m.277060 type:complete len:261 (+) Transcript_97950:1016-1798(+)
MRLSGVSVDPVSTSQRLPALSSFTSSATAIAWKPFQCNKGSLSRSRPSQKAANACLNESYLLSAFVAKRSSDTSGETVALSVSNIARKSTIRKSSARNSNKRSASKSVKHIEVQNFSQSPRLRWYDEGRPLFLSISSESISKSASMMAASLAASGLLAWQSCVLATSSLAALAHAQQLQRRRAVRRFNLVALDCHPCCGHCTSSITLCRFCLLMSKWKRRHRNSHKSAFGDTSTSACNQLESVTESFEFLSIASKSSSES